MRAAGEAVQTGQLLFRLYSARLEVAEQEYLSSLQFADASRVALAEQRLRDLGLEPAFIASLREQREIPHLIPFHAPTNGVITELGVRQGAFVSHETLLMRLASLDKVWVIAQVPQRFAGLIRVGDTTSLTVDAYSGRTFEGNVDYVYPQLDADTRNVRVRIAVSNSDGRLRPNMYASATLTAAGESPVLLIPRDCVIRDGEGDRVILAMGKGSFTPRHVRIGQESGDDVVVLEGLKAGDLVVTAALFLIDSQANLESSLGRFGAASPTSESSLRGEAPAPSNASR